jgi:hypothetical protein
MPDGAESGEYRLIDESAPAMTEVSTPEESAANPIASDLTTPPTSKETETHWTTPTGLIILGIVVVVAGAAVLAFVLRR